MKLTKNVGRKDAALRFFIAAVILAINFYTRPAAPLNWILYALSLIVALTAQFGFCPIYAVLRIKTNKKD